MTLKQKAPAAYETCNKQIRYQYKFVGSDIKANAIALVIIPTSTTNTSNMFSKVYLKIFLKYQSKK